ncbi:hypothetical protein BIV57_07270 [Mangrovactinospora gilvigrisea]|uniref:DUF58 domain-containing protein n=1 Tax=Mangrovactinospora gilvigrisea TaxID=1428644 RepID=A0A1J7CER1_9ACTN|nr:DUF58 domain-containing protein [Mangrovactinospora gilvigrisea]OIV38170.1 hypothetical protein BIV57_07270 [Mangrovactinospora gilvigrisea]
MSGLAAFRAALAGLTTRGRSFLAAGLAAVACAVVLGQSDLLRVGILLAVLPLLCAAALVRSRFKIAGGRRLTPSRVHAGQDARVYLRVDNVSRVPSGTLLLEDKVPYVLGARPRFVLDRVEPRGHREVSYRVRSDMRGRYRLGPLQLRLADPFGMCELTRSFQQAEVLTVVPSVLPLPTVQLAGEWGGYGDNRARSIAAAGDDDVIPRGYRYGDDIRRVHWRSTARYGELMVRREEQPLRSRCTLLLDTRDGAHTGTGPASTFEWAVSAVASLSVHLISRGYAVRMLTGDGLSVPDRDGSGEPGPETSGLLLDALAVLDTTTMPGLARALDALRVSGEGLLIAVLGALDEEEAARLAALRRRTGGAIALLLDTAAWAGGEPATGAAARVLGAAGWTVLPVPPSTPLPALWRTLNSRPGVPKAHGWGAGAQGRQTAPAGDREGSKQP